MQTLAEKGQLAALYPWQSVLDSVFTFKPSKDVSVEITEQDGKWCMTAAINGKHYVGERSTLEDAAKACFKLLYDHAKEKWLHMDARALTDVWCHSLENV